MYIWCWVDSNVVLYLYCKGPSIPSVSVNSATMLWWRLQFCSHWKHWSHLKMGCKPNLEGLHCFQWEQNRKHHCSLRFLANVSGVVVWHYGWKSVLWYLHWAQAGGAEMETHSYKFSTGRRFCVGFTVPQFYLRFSLLKYFKRLIKVTFRCRSDLLFLINFIFLLFTINWVFAKLDKLRYVICVDIENLFQNFLL